MQTEFVRNLNCNYERILLERKPEEKRYQYCILNRGGIRGLLSCSLRYINGLAYLYYDISSKQNMKQLYDARCFTRECVRDFLWSMGQVRQELERFLLDVGNVVWYPEQIYRDLESNTYSFLYVPYYEGENGFKQLLEFWVEHIDYDDEELVDCVYHIYEQYEQSGDVYLQTQIFEDAKKLDEVKAKEEQNCYSEEEKDYHKVNYDYPMEVKPAEQKRHLFDIFDARKKRNREMRENYRRDMQGLMSGTAVAEDSIYMEEHEMREYSAEECGRTVYMEEVAEPERNSRELCAPGGKTLAVLEKPATTIGKKKGEADIVLEDTSVSRLHAKITKEKQAYYIEDMNSTNGTFKNGLRLQPYEKRELEEGDEIKVGRVMLVFR